MLKSLIRGLHPSLPHATLQCAPSFGELYRPTVNGSSPGFIFDTVIGDFDQWPTTKQANPDLTPEKSKQILLGVVLQLLQRLSASLHYWSIRKTDVISDLNEKTMLSAHALSRLHHTRQQ
jgi:iron complex outermembrane recepter protein